MNIWLRLSSTFHEHPKMLEVRSRAGSRADSAELGWYRILMAAKRYGRWDFASEAHLAHVSGRFYRFVPLYRAAKLLDNLTIHDGETYNATKTDGERKAEQRNRERGNAPQRDNVSHEGVTTERDMPRDQNVTLDKRERIEKKERAEQDARDPWADPEHEAIAWLAKHGCDIRPGNGYHRKLVTAVEAHGVNALIGMFDRLAEAGTKHGDVKGFLFGAIDALDARTRPKLADVSKAERADDTEAAHQRRLAATQRHLAELRGTGA